MSEHDDHELRSRLQWLSAQRVDDDRAYAELLRRVRVAKRRRVTIASISLTGALILGLVANGISSGTSRTITNPSVEVSITDSTQDPTTSTNVIATSTSASTTTTAPTTTAPTTTAPTTTESASSTTDTVMSPIGGIQPDVPAPMPSASPSAGGGTTASTTGKPKPKPTPTTTAPNQPAQTSEATTTAEPTQTGEATATSEPSTSLTTATTAEVTQSSQPTTTNGTRGETKSVVALHGHIVVQLLDGNLHLLDHQAESGYTYRVDIDEDTHIRVRFVNGVNASLIDVVNVGGHISSTVTEGSDGQFESAPSTTAYDRTQSQGTTPPDR